MIHVLRQAIFTPLKVFNREDHIKDRLWASISMVIMTALLGSVVAPVIYFYTYQNKYEIQLDLGSMILGFAVSMITWLVVCTMFWLLSKAFHKGIVLGQVAATWGLSYIPNLFCIILYNLLLTHPGIYNGSGFSTFIISSLFLLFLIWKAIFYFILMRSVLNTTLLEITVCTAVSALVFTILMMVGFWVGIQVPML